MKTIPEKKQKVLITAQIDEDLYNEAKLHLKKRQLKIKDVVQLAFENFVHSCRDEKK